MQCVLWIYSFRRHARQTTVTYSCDVEIGLPRSRVIELFDDPDNLLKWQPDLIRFEPLSGTPGRPGATSRLTYRAGKGELEMIETITERDLQDVFSGTYKTKMGVTEIRNRFIDRGNTTRWIVDTEYKASGMMKILSPFLRGVIRKQTQTVVDNFKAFAESQAH